MSDLVIQKSTFAHMQAATFSSFAAQYPQRTAMILEKMLFPDTDDYESGRCELEVLRRVIHLVMVLPENPAAEVLSAFRCLSDESDHDFFDQFTFEMARIAEFDPFFFADALADFTIAEAAEPFFGIDRVKVIGEKAFGTQRMVDCINRLTDELEAQESAPKDAH